MIGLVSNDAWSAAKNAKTQYTLRYTRKVFGILHEKIRSFKKAVVLTDAVTYLDSKLRFNLLYEFGVATKKWSAVFIR